MKRIVLLTALTAVCFGCEETPQENIQGPETTLLIGSWQTTREQIVFTDHAGTEHTSDVGVSEGDSYRLTLNDAGSGHASGIDPNSGSRYTTDIAWELPGDELIVRSTNDGIVMYLNWKTPDIDDWVWTKSINWAVNTLTDSELVLSSETARLVDGENSGGTETLNYRLTLRKVE